MKRPQSVIAFLQLPVELNWIFIIILRVLLSPLSRSISFGAGVGVGIGFRFGVGLGIRIDGGGGVGERGEVEVGCEIGLVLVVFSEEHQNGVVLIAEVAEVDGAVAVDDENAGVGGEVEGFAEVSVVAPINQNDGERLVV